MRRLLLLLLQLLLFISAVQSLQNTYPIITSTWIGMGSTNPQRYGLVDTSLHLPQYSVTGVALHPISKDLYFVSQLAQVNILSRDRSTSKILFHSQLTSTPHSITFDSTGQLLFLSDSNLHVVQQWNLTSNELITLAGINGTSGSTGNDGPASNATLHSPVGLSFDNTSRRLFIADKFNYAIRYVDLNTQFMYHYLGTYIPGSPTLMKNETQLLSPECVKYHKNQVYVCDDKRVLVVNDTINDNSVLSVDAGGIVSDLAFDNTDTILYLAQTNTISVLDLSTLIVTRDLFNTGTTESKPSSTDGVGTTASFSKITNLAYDEEEQALYGGEEKDLMIRKLIKSLQAPSVFQRSVSVLSWTPVPSATYYTVNGSVVIGNAIDVAATITNSSTTLQVTSMFGVTGVSTTISYLPPPTLSPLQQLASTTNESMITVMWTPPQQQQQPYAQVELQLYSAMDQFLTAVNVTTPATQYSFTSLSSNTLYKVQWRAFDDYGICSPWSPLIAFATLPTPPQITIELLQASSLLVDFTYSASAPQGPLPIMLYLVQVFAVDTQQQQQQQQFNSSLNNVAIHNLTPNTTYHIRVQVMNSMRWISQQATVVTVTTLLVDTAPMTPIQIRFTRLSRSSVNVTWTLPPSNTIPVHYYTIAFSNQTFQTNDSFIVLQGIIPSVNMDYRISAVNTEYGSSVPSITSYSNAPDAPSAPLNVMVISLGITSLHVQFDTPIDDGGAPILSYLIRYTNNSIQNNQYIDATAAAAATTKTIVAQLTKLAPNTTYLIEVIALNGQSSSPLSNATTITTFANVLAVAPSNLKTEEVLAHSWVVSWDMDTMTAGGPVLFYIIRLTIINRAVRYSYQLDAQYSGVNFTELYADTDYMMDISAVNLAGVGPFSQPIAVRTQMDGPGAPYDHSDLNFTIAMGLGIGFLVILIAIVLLVIAAILAGVVVYWNRDKIFKPLPARAPVGATRVYSTAFDGPVVEEQGTHVELDNI